MQLEIEWPSDTTTFWIGRWNPFWHSSENISDMEQMSSSMINLFLPPLPLTLTPQIKFRSLSHFPAFITSIYKSFIPLHFLFYCTLSYLLKPSIHFSRSIHQNPLIFFTHIYCIKNKHHSSVWYFRIITRPPLKDHLLLVLEHFFICFFLFTCLVYTYQGLWLQHSTILMTMDRCSFNKQLFLFWKKEGSQSMLDLL